MADDSIVKHFEEVCGVWLFYFVALMDSGELALSFKYDALSSFTIYYIINAPTSRNSRCYRSVCKAFVVLTLCLR